MIGTVTADDLFTGLTTRLEALDTLAAPSRSRRVLDVDAHQERHPAAPTRDRGVAAREPSRHVPGMGEFILDNRSDGDGNGLAAQIAREIDEGWPMLAAVDNDVERATKAAEDTVEFIRQRGRTW